MNYSKKGIRKKQKQLNAHGIRWSKKLALGGIELLLIALIAVAMIGISAGIGVFRGILATAPDISNIDVSPSGYSTFVYDAAGNQTAKLVSTDANRIPVTFAQIPENLAHAFVATEDERFYQHNGIDIQGIMRAGFTAIKNRKLGQGASTITQQLLKNNVFTNWTSESQMESIKRKIQEQYLAIELEKVMTKDAILENYMNTVNLGQNTLGVQAASLRYFNKNVSDLTLSECAVIAGITQNPSRYNPISHPENNEAKRKIVLDKMLAQGYISNDEYKEALNDDVYSRIQIVNEENGDDTVNSYFVDALVGEVLDDLVAAGYTENQAYTLLYSGGLKIYSTQDPVIQGIMDEAFSNEDNFPKAVKWLLSYELTTKDADGTMRNYSTETFERWFKDNVSASYTRLYNSQESAYEDIEKFKEQALTAPGEEMYRENVSLVPQPQISMTIEDQSTGYVVAMMGGRGAKTASRTLNRAHDVKRQPGSCFKVLAAFAPALDSAGLTLATVHTDEPYEYEGGRPVKNWYTGYRGICSIRDGIRDSLNIIAVKTLTQITPQLGFDYLQNFGFTTLVASMVGPDGKIYSDIQQALALGGVTKGVTNMELNAAYASIANGGVYLEPILYTKITDHDGNVILDRTQTQESRRVIKETTAFLLTDAMEDVITTGTAKDANFGGMTIAGKTGTTTSYRDVWFAAYTPYYTASVWVGIDDNSILGKNDGSRSLARSMWRTVMQKVHADLDNRAFPMPEGIVTATVCSQSGKLPVTGLCDACLKTEYFAEGTVPTDTCDVHYTGNYCLYDNLPATDLCPFAVQRIMTRNPDNLEENAISTEITGDENSGDSVDTSLDEELANATCQHTAEFFANPELAAQVIEMQRQQLIALGLIQAPIYIDDLTGGGGDGIVPDPAP